MAALIIPLGGTTPATLVLSVSGFAIAWVIGFLVLVAPAGAGARELALAGCLAAVLSNGEATTVAVASRVLMTSADVVLAAAAALLLRRFAPSTDLAPSRTVEGRSITVGTPTGQEGGPKPMLAKTMYVATMRALRSQAGAVGLRQPVAGERGARAHLRSLLDVHDADALIRWDMPWWTYKAVDEVDAYLAQRPSARVFEYGSGASTVWLARRSAEVHTVEHDEEWADILAPRLLSFDNVTLHHVPPESVETPVVRSGRRGYADQDFSRYVDRVHEVGGLFDIVVIDGRARMDCLMAAVEHVKPSGVVIVDNSARKRYRAALFHADGGLAIPGRGTRSPLPGRDGPAHPARRPDRQGGERRGPSAHRGAKPPTLSSLIIPIGGS